MSQSDTTENPRLSSPTVLLMNEAAKILLVSRRTLERYAADGLITRTKYRGRAVIAVQELERFIESHAQGKS